MHVLVIPSWYPTTEAPQDGIYFAEQAQALAQSGLKMGVVFPEHQSLRRLSLRAVRRKHFQVQVQIERGVPTVRRLSWNVWWRTRMNLYCRIRDAVTLGHRYVRTFGRPDLIHAQSARWAGAAAANLSEALGIPFVLTEHFTGFRRGVIFPWQWSLIQRGLEQADTVSAVSTSLRQDLRELNQISVSDVHLLPNLVDTNFFTPPPTAPPASPFRFLTVAKLQVKKNIDGLLQAFAEAFSATDAVCLDIIGDGPKRAYLESLAQRMGLQDQVAFHGSLGRLGVRNALRACHTYVQPSHHETFGVVIIEALATGRPVLATACGGPEDIITPETGCLIPVRDLDALVEGLQQMRATASAYAPDVLHADAVRRFGPEPFCRRTRSFYERAL